MASVVARVDDARRIICFNPIRYQRLSKRKWCPENGIVFIPLIIFWFKKCHKRSNVLSPWALRVTLEASIPPCLPISTPLIRGGWVIQSILGATEGRGGEVIFYA
ncbi:hypothetical protein AVEN_35398-1 [Araneus ventricosus]|uniref:Uncharacterized protein n=1 Tax=Araneus ventricosus TaxID=182803 RepID=A0A4Y2VFD2_ARAVE|nr:hypothetical protein AVEN_35398-1 [Araneus ventricosus]